ncbi:alpha/beta fold hydrolase [Ensifer adhaerens]|uniref:alpha/beta fold hydrolase n=1 Tax=Ensifer adhaerens TaxID=106592 RepID=UPI003D04D023
MAGPDFDSDSHTAWISKGFERLVDRVRKAPAALHFDVLVVGSGYGGAIAAATLAGRTNGTGTVKVAVLERGKEYLPGSFPTGLGELPRHIRRDRNKEGLVDVRIGPEVVTVVANGVGGGSLINAGVMEVPDAKVFQSRWPDDLKDLTTWRQYFDRACELLGGAKNGVANSISKHPDGIPQKHKSFRNIAPSGFREAAITVAMTDTESSGNVKLNKCVRCGDCATGCNFGAKNSLDVNLLVTALRKKAEIFSGATVLSIEQDAGNWIVNCVYTDAALRARDGEVLQVRAAKVVLAAGTLGSFEILKRSQAAGLALSLHLGNHCSTNGDMLVTDYATSNPVNTVSNETLQPSKRAIGPTITGVIDLRKTAGVLIEELSVPASLRLAFTEIFATLNTLHGLDRIDWSTHAKGFPTDDAYVVPTGRIEHSAVYAVMADDGAAGRLELDGTAAESNDGIARVRWDDLPSLPVFDAEVEALARLTRNTGGRIIANPVWKLLPVGLNWLLQNKRGPLTTVHPLGGCVMGNSGATGVVDHLGRVFKSDAPLDFHAGLVVLDGSIIPTALGTNPALTIAAVALRASETLAAEWSYAVPAPAAPASPTAPTAPEPPSVRPVFRETDVAAAAPDADAEIIERLVGRVSFSSGGAPAEARIVELTLRFEPKALIDLAPSNGGDGTLKVATDATVPLARSMIRIFPADQWENLHKTWAPAGLKEQKLEAIAVFTAPLTGSLRVLERQSSWVGGRIWRAGKAWVLNRGLRDSYQAIVDGDGGPGFFERVRSGLAIASRSGEIRAFVYDLKIGAPDPITGGIALAGDRIVGTKRFTYDRRSNPWRQLMEVALEQFPGAEATGGGVLTLDLDYLARIGVPLFRMTEQRDGVAAIGALLTFLGYFLRLLLGMHIWSFRAPDKDKDPANDVVDFRPPAQLKVPGGTVAAQRQTLVVGTTKPQLGGPPVLGKILLTRYPYPGTTKRPLVMIHGYSAGGTTFAHHAVDPNFASHFWKTGRDVWIADLRTSPAHPTASAAWSFDEIGKEDVPLVLKTISTQTGAPKLDVIAHCMGTMVFSIAALEGKITDLVDRVAFTQVGPLVVFTPANIFRAYVVRYLLGFLPDSYSFNPETPTLADDLWDRVLSTLPYPVEEFDVENPVWPWKRTPWTRTRHRMDALYGRDFNVANMEPEMLRFINEHFGALSLNTVSTTVHFVRNAMLTNYKGQNTLVARKKLEEQWRFPTFSLHGSANGLTDPATVDRMRRIFDDAGRVYLEPYLNPGAGHQDALVGTTRHASLQKIEAFLNQNIQRQPVAADAEMTAYPPWIGPIITEENGELIIRLGALPSIRQTEGVIMLRVQLNGDDLLRPDGQPWDLPYVLSHMMVYWSPALRDNRWDAFKAPLPMSMPGYDPNYPGNALLVLLAYAEDAFLAPPGAIEAEYYALAKEGIVYEAFPLASNANPEKILEALPFRRFERISSAVSRTMNAPRPDINPVKASKLAPNRLVFKDMTPTTNLTVDAGPATETTAASAMTLNFLMGESALENLVEQDRALMDGVIPYDSPPLGQPASGDTSFILGSCQYPAGFIDGKVAYRSYADVADRIGAGAGIRPKFALFVGDQVYVDPTAGLYDPAANDDRYRLPYEAWLRERSVREVLRRIPSFMLLDDHEIGDNWEPLASPNDIGSNADLKKYGLEAYEKYQRGLLKSLEEFDYEGLHFFLLDTRSQRSHRKIGAGLANATLFKAGNGETFSRLETWLGKVGPKFIASPAMFLPRHRRAVQRDVSLSPDNLSALHSDGWDGYPNSLRDVLGVIAAGKIRHVVFLSGDEHRGCVATAQLTELDHTPITTVHSIHTAAMYAPYPFANGIDEDIVEQEAFEFDYMAKRYRCIVEATRPAPRDGATFLRVRQDAGDWKLDCEYAGAVQTLVL